MSRTTSSLTYSLSAVEVLYGLASDSQGEHVSGEHVSERAMDDALPRAGLLPESDRALVDEIHQGHERALEQLFVTYHPELHAIATTMTGSLASADDVINDVFDALWTVRAEWNPVYGIRAYLVRAVRNRARNALRAEHRQRRLEQRALVAVASESPPGMGTAAPAVDEQLDADELSQIVWDVIGRLPEASQLILTLRWRHGLSWDAVAHAMGTSAGAVQMQHNRACKVLRQRLARHLR